MKLNTNSNAYIIIYSAILVVIVAFLLAFVYQALKPMQDANVALDVKKQILYSLNIRNLDGAEAEAKYAEVVKAETEIDGQKAYACLVDGEEIMVFALKGMGLWGGISGYIAIHGEDDPTVYGAYFNHESETAGLGAEIKDSQAWQEKFIGKKVFVDGDVALSVVKKVENPETQVDCVTGATLTSNGVNDMIQQGLKVAVQRYQQAAKGCCQEANDSCQKAKDCCHEPMECCKEANDSCQKAKDGCKEAKNCCKDSKAAAE
ncbi:MAG: FMN-binding protein [Prevotella sp.]|nr:FMN-binding protein [Prevotella sp.]